MNAIKLLFLSALFCGAGLLHLERPEIFVSTIPGLIPYRLELIFATGYLEIVLGLGLLLRKTRDLSARFSALYLICLLPIHVYVSLEGIEVFGVQSSTLLWIRTFLQFGLIFLALSLQDKGAMIYQRWRDVVFLHYEIAPEKLRELVPFPLDLFEGKAILSIVPFRMDRIRLPFLPPLPWLSNLWELNLRTYVNVNGVKGVYFFTLETDSRVGEAVARSLFHLPYRRSIINASLIEREIFFSHHRESYKFELRAEYGGIKETSPLEEWATERYDLFLQHKGASYQGTVRHSPWVLRSLSPVRVTDQFTSLVTGKNEIRFLGGSFTKELNVSFAPFKRVIL